jgi:hypothetical protein
MSDKNSLNHKAWLRFKRNKVAVGGLAVIILTFLIAVFAYEIAPDNTPDANEQTLPIEMSRPGSIVRFLILRKPFKAEVNGHSLEHFFFGTPSLYERIPIMAFRMKYEFMYVDVYKGKSRPIETRKYYYTIVSNAPSRTSRVTLSLTTKHSKGSGREYSKHSYRLRYSGWVQTGSDGIYSAG